MGIGRQFFRMRVAAGLTQDAVAEQMCITRQTLFTWERDITLPDIFFNCPSGRIVFSSIG